MLHGHRRYKLGKQTGREKEERLILTEGGRGRNQEKFLRIDAKVFLQEKRHFGRERERRGFGTSPGQELRRQTLSGQWENATGRLGSPCSVLGAGLLEEVDSSGIATQGWYRGKEVTQDTPVKAQGSGSHTSEYICKRSSTVHLRFVHCTICTR